MDEAGIFGVVVGYRHGFMFPFLVATDVVKRGV